MPPAVRAEVEAKLAAGERGMVPMIERMRKVAV
jgi:hypothetical protein